MSGEHIKRLRRPVRGKLTSAHKAELAEEARIIRLRRTLEGVALDMLAAGACDDEVQERTGLAAAIIRRLRREQEGQR